MSLPVQEVLRIDWSRIRKSSAISATCPGENGASILSVGYFQDVGNPSPDGLFMATLDAPMRLPPEGNPRGISFEVRGDGSDAYASIMLGYLDNCNVMLGYEAIFPLDSMEWKNVTLKWEAFVQNYLPWDAKSPQDLSAPLLEPARIASIGFGLGHYFHKHYPAHTAFQIRNISLVHQIFEDKAASFSEKWSHTRTVLGKKRKYRILLIGDSITELGGNQSYGDLLGRKIKEKWGNDCETSNCGIGGHSVRAGTIILPRSLRTMPDPDLVFVLFGANDVKALGLKHGFNEETFKIGIEGLIDKIRAGTGGETDICLLSGVPRLLPDGAGSAGTVEQIVNGIKRAAEDKRTGFVDTFDTYLHLAPGQQKTYYADTVHPTPAGQEFLASLIFGELNAKMTDGSELRTESFNTTK